MGSKKYKKIQRKNKSHKKLKRYKGGDDTPTSIKSPSEQPSKSFLCGIPLVGSLVGLFGMCKEPEKEESVKIDTSDNLSKSQEMEPSIEEKKEQTLDTPLDTTKPKSDLEIKTPLLENTPTENATNGGKKTRKTKKSRKSKK